MKKRIIILFIVMLIALVIGLIVLNRVDIKRHVIYGRLEELQECVNEYSGEQSGRKVKEMLEIMSNKVRESDDITIFCEFYDHSFTVTKKGNKIDPDSPYKDRLKSIEALIEDDLMYYINYHNIYKTQGSLTMEIYDIEKAKEYYLIKEN